MVAVAVKFIGVAAIAFVLASCSHGKPSDQADPGDSLAGTTVTSTTAPGPTTTTSRTTTTSTTSTSTTTAAPTTTLPSSLDIEGSPMIEFRIEVDPALADHLTRAELVAFVIETLSDERSWTGRGVGFRLVDEGGLFTMTVASPERVDQLCAPLATNGRYSCARNGWIAFNSDRWFGATESWPGDLVTYRRYLVNHEIGHYIMGPAHALCPGEGLPAPVMMQQTKGLHGCEPNGWVDP